MHTSVINRLSILTVCLCCFSAHFGKAMNKTISKGFENCSKQTIHTEITREDPDSTAITQAFEALKTNKAFLRQLGLEHEQQYSWFKGDQRIIRGDVDADGQMDALYVFAIENRGGGNNWDGHYAVFLNKKGQWKYHSIIDAGGNLSTYIINFESIDRGKIAGSLIPQNDQSLPDIKATYMYKNGTLIPLVIALHKTQHAIREYLQIENITTSDGHQVPLTATKVQYDKILGPGKVSNPATQPVCGTYFDEGFYSDLYYGLNLHMELKDGREAAWRSIQMHGTANKINTDKGTVTSKTTLEELKSIFYNKDSWSVMEAGNGGQVLRIPDGPQADTELRFRFNKTGQLESVTLFIPC